MTDAEKAAFKRLSDFLNAGTVQGLGNDLRLILDGFRTADAMLRDAFLEHGLDKDDLIKQQTLRILRYIRQNEKDAQGNYRSFWSDTLVEIATHYGLPLERCNGCNGGGGWWASERWPSQRQAERGFCSPCEGTGVLGITGLVNQTI